MMIALFKNRTVDTGSTTRGRRFAFPLLLLGLTQSVVLTGAGQSGLATNVPAIPPLPGSAAVAFSLFRVLGALAIVLAVFFGGVWLFRNWQRTVVARGQSPKLNIIETRSLGQRHAIYLIGYEQQRLLIAASPAGVTMLTTLPVASAEPAEAAPIAKSSFTAALRQALQSKS